jgi:CheY-like chemotaxis protein
MNESILNNKTVLAVDDEPDILEVLEEVILAKAPKCTLDMASSYEQACELLASYTYDLVILDIMGVRGFDLLKVATDRPNSLPTVMLTAAVFSPESFKKSVVLGARAYLPKEKLISIVPFLEDVLTYEYGHAWRRVLKSIEGIISKSWGPYWRKPDSDFWDTFESKVYK